MAVFRSGTLFPVNFALLNLADLLDGTITTATDSQVIVTTPETRTEFFGAGVTYNTNGLPNGGTLMALGEYAYGAFFYAVSGLNIPVPQFMSWVFNNQNSAALTAAFAGADDIGGSPHDDLLMGLGGNDFIQGFEGNDTLHGDAGNDYLDGGNGIDAMYGGAGNDAYVVINVGDGVVENNNAGTDTVLAYFNYVLPSNVENVQLLGGALSATGNSSANLMFGNELANALDGASGDDTAYGFGGADAIAGGVGNDALYGGAGNDLIDGGTLNDVLSGEDGDDTIFGRTGNDTIVGGLGNDILAGEHYAEETAGSDLIVGGFGNDSILGGAGTDTLYGEFGDDVILGGTSGDVIIGGQGADAMDGGGSPDLFRYTSIADYYPAGNDTIINFSTAVGASDGFDMIQLFDSVGAPTLTVANAEAQGWLRVIQDGNDALVQFDINGGGDNFGTVVRLLNVNAASVTDNMFLI